MGMKSHIVPFCKLSTAAHEVGRDRKGRAGRQGDLDLRAVAALVVAMDQSLAVGEDHLGSYSAAVGSIPGIAAYFDEKYDE